MAGPVSFANVFTSDFGADGPLDDDGVAGEDDDAITYALGLADPVGDPPVVDSGLVDTLTGDRILLRLDTDGNVEGYLEGDDTVLAFEISVNTNTGAVSMTQSRAVVHDDATDSDEAYSAEPGENAAQTLASADLITLTATITDGDGDTDTATANIGQAFYFEDDGPSLDVGNIVGTGTVDPQIGEWSALFGADGQAAQGSLSLVLNDVTVNGIAIGDVPLDLDLGDATFMNGEWTFTDVVVDIDGPEGDRTIMFDLTFREDGTYVFNLDGGFSSSVVTSSADGSLDAGGPDTVRTLSFTDPLTSVVFFGVNAETPAGDILYAIGAGLDDRDEADLEGDQTIDFFSAAAMNVSTSGIGLGNNNFDGDRTAGISADDESFIINPERPLSEMIVYIDNSVSGYNPASEEIYYRIFYTDGGDSGFLLVGADDLEPVTEGVASGGVRFSIMAEAGRTIDAVQLVMGSGTVKIPVIEFVEETATIADDINLAFTATITDGDGDAVSDSFSVDLGADDDPLTAPDFTLTGLAAQDDAFNIDVGSGNTDWVVNGFDAGDRIVLLNADAPHALETDPASGADAEISVNGTQVVIDYADGFAGEITEADILVAYGDLVIDGAVSFGGDATGGENSDAFVSDGSGDTLTGGDGADAFVYFEPPAAGDTITDFDGAEGDRFVISASGFDVALDEGALSSDKFVFGDGAVAADSDDYFLYDTADGSLYFDADGSGSDATPVLVATLDGIPALEADDIVVIA